MASKNRKVKKSSNTVFIKDVTSEINLDSSFVSEFPYPLFCFKWFQNDLIKDCKDYKFFFDVLTRLKKMSELGWKEIRKSGRHQYGFEKIPVESLHPKREIEILTPDVKKVDVCRATGNNLPMIGLVEGSVFHVIYIESNFGDIYNHG